MADEHMKRCSTLLVIREMKMKTTKRYHLIPIKMAIIKGIKKKYWQRCRETATLMHCW